MILATSWAFYDSPRDDRLPSLCLTNLKKQSKNLFCTVGACSWQNLMVPASCSCKLFARCRRILASLETSLSMPEHFHACPCSVGCLKFVVKAPHVYDKSGNLVTEEGALRQPFIPGEILASQAYIRRLSD